MANEQTYELRDTVRAVFDALHTQRLGGPADTVAALTISGSLLLTFTTHVPFIAGVAQFAAATAGALWLSWVYTEKIRNRFVLPSSIALRSSESPIKEVGEKPGLLIGYSTDKGAPVILPDTELFRHLCIIGMSGVGKTVAGSNMMFQQIQRGGGLLFIDGKLDYGNITSIYQFAAWCGRGAEFLVINPGDPAMSNTYNPLLDGNAYEVSSRALSMVSEDPGADYYRSEANQAIMTVVAAIKKAGKRYNFDDLAILFNSAAALEDLEGICKRSHSDAKETRDLQLWIDRFRLPPDPSGKNPLAGQVDLKRMKETLGGITSKMSSFSTGSFGDVMNTYSPDVNLYKAFQKSQIIYVALPTMGMPDAAASFAKMLVGDLRTACSWLQKNHEDRPKIPYMCFMDEARSYLSETWGVLYEQARSAGLFLLPAFQTMPQDAKMADVMDRVIGNTTSKMVFRIGTNETAEKCADMIGQHMTVETSMADAASASESAQTIKFEPGKTSGDGFGQTTTQKQSEDYIVSPDDLKKLDKGEAVLLYEGRDVYNLRIAMMELDSSYTKRIGPCVINRFRPKIKEIEQGLNLRAKSEGYLSKSKERPAGKSKGEGQAEVADIDASDKTVTRERLDALAQAIAREKENAKKALQDNKSPLERAGFTIKDGP